MAAGEQEWILGTAVLRGSCNFDRRVYEVSPVMAAQVVEKRVAGEKSSVAEFKRRFNDDFDELMLKLRWDKFRFSFRLAVNALIDEVESKPKVTGDDSALAKWDLDVQQKVDAEMPPWMRTKTYLELRRSIERRDAGQFLIHR